MVIDEDFFHSIISNVYLQLGVSTEGFMYLQLIILAMFSAVDFASSVLVQDFFSEITFKTQLVWLADDFTLKYFLILCTLYCYFLQTWSELFLIVVEAFTKQNSCIYNQFQT